MMTALALCGAHWIVGWPKEWELKPLLKSMAKWTGVYFFLWLAQSVLYVEVILGWWQL